MIGSSMPASVMIPKNRIANTNMPDHRGDVLDTGNDEGTGLQAEPADQRGDDRQGDQCHQGRKAFAHDSSEQAEDGNDTEGGEHGRSFASLIGLSMDALLLFSPGVLEAR